MSSTEILEQIRRLSPEEQHEVLEKLREEIGEVDEQLTPGQIAELDRRAEEFRKNPLDGIPWEKAREDAHKRFGWK